MLKTSAVTAVVLILGLPVCTLARTAQSPRTEKESHSERLPFARTNDSPSDGKPPCEGNSVQEFLQGKCDKLKGFDSVRGIRSQSNDGKWSFPAFYEFSPIHRVEKGTFVKEAGGHAWRIYGDDGTRSIPPFFERKGFRTFGPEGEFSKQSVDDFMQGKKDRLRGVDPIPYELKKPPLPPAWGGDEFVQTEGFTQSGPPYQNVNPLYGIDPPKLENFKPGFKFDAPKFENIKQLQK